MRPELESLLDAGFPALLRQCMRRRQIPLRALARVPAEEIRHAAIVEILRSRPHNGAPADGLAVRRAVGRACWRLVEREDRLALRRRPIAEAAGRAAAGADPSEALAWEDQLARLPPDARDLLEALLAEFGAARRRTPFASPRAQRERIALLLRTFLGADFLDDARALLERRRAELAGGPARLSPGQRARARRYARVLRRLPIGFALRSVADEVARAERRRAPGERGTA